MGQAFYGTYEGLRDIQEDAMADLLAGNNVLVLSPTGSGKTEAVVAPLIERHLVAMRGHDSPTILYVTPTRALANDLLRRLDRPMDDLGLGVGIRHGDRNDLQRAVKLDLLITTPESLDVMLTAREDALHTLAAVVVDEVHLVYNTQRGLQLSVLLRRLELLLGRDLQVAALSATVASSEDVWQFLRPGSPHVAIQDRTRRPIDAHVQTLSSDHELGVFLQNLRSGRPFKTLLFANSRRQCDALAASINGVIGPNRKVWVHHSALSRELRLETEARFQESPDGVCVATSTLELGVDIGDVDLVALYGPPAGWESFVQRIGRGNRRGSKSNVLCLVAPGAGSEFRQRLAFNTLLWQMRHGHLEQRPAMQLYGAAAQQVLSVLLQAEGGYTRLSDLDQMLQPWPHLTGSALEEIVAELSSRGHLQRHGFLNRVGAGEGLHRMRDLGAIWGNFPVGSGAVSLKTGSRELGSISTANLFHLQVGGITRFAGRRWRVRRISRDGIEVEPTRAAGPCIDIEYGGRAASLDPALAEGMLAFMSRVQSGLESWLGDDGGFTDLVAKLPAQVGLESVLATHEDGRVTYYTFAGQTMNEVLLSLAGASGISSGEVYLQTMNPFDFGSLPEDISALTDVALSKLRTSEALTVYQEALPEGLLRRELAEFWLKSPVNQRNLDRLRRGPVLDAGGGRLTLLHF